MANVRFSWMSFFLRFLVALVLVYSTYNPHEYSYYHWVKNALFGGTGNTFQGSNALLFICGVVLLTGWIGFLTATRRSLGLLGITLSAALCGGLIWLLIDLHLVPEGNPVVMTHIILIVISAILAVGLSWSHITRRLTGQVTTDEVE